MPYSIRRHALGGFVKRTAGAAEAIVVPVVTLTTNGLGVPGDTVSVPLGAVHVAFVGAPLHATV
jgi:hypothetical protein